MMMPILQQLKCFRDVSFLTDTRIKVFLHTLDSKTLEYFSKYDYGSWKPPKARRDWMKAWIGAGEYIDIGCGAYPVSMDVPCGKERGIGVDIAPEAAHNALNYFREFYLFNIEKIEKHEVLELVERFDYAVLSEALEHFKDPCMVLEKTLWFLKPGGKLLITYPNAYSIAQWIDRLVHFGRWHRFRDFHRSHIFLVQKRTLEKMFGALGLGIAYFDFRPSDIIEHWPDEKNQIWHGIAKFCPAFLGHQFLYVLIKKS